MNRGSEHVARRSVGNATQGDRNGERTGECAVCTGKRATGWHSQVAGAEIVFHGWRLGSLATSRWSEKDGVGGFFLLGTFDTMGRFVQEVFCAEIGEVERGHDVGPGGWCGVVYLVSMISHSQDRTWTDWQTEKYNPEVF